MKIIEGFDSARELLSREVSAFAEDSKAAETVRQIIDDVKGEGDAALRRYTVELDGVDVDPFEVARERVAEAYESIDAGLLSALKLAAEQVESFHRQQKEGIWAGVAAMGGRQRLRPLERVGIYVPGGTASYPSSVLMTAIPAGVAGVTELIMATPPAGNGLVPAATLVAADIAGVDRIFAIGGAQAVAAMAFGTESVPKVDKICGPGNIFVTLAKKMVYGSVAIDGLQGPSEVLIIADATADAGCCAADLLAQAEHDPLSAAILVTCSRRLADAVSGEIEKQLAGLERRPIIEKALRDGGVIAVVADMDEAVKLANLYAPEHLCLLAADAAAYVDRIINAGCIFVGGGATVALGDYVAGPSHVLPTGGTARFASPLNINDFIKLMDVVAVDEAGLKKLGAAAVTIARAEGLEAHARAVEKRLR